MILVDTTIWVDHLRSGLPQLTAALQKCAVLIHPWVIGEQACRFSETLHRLALSTPRSL